MVNTLRRGQFQCTRCMKDIVECKCSMNTKETVYAITKFESLKPTVE